MKNTDEDAAADENKIPDESQSSMQIVNTTNTNMSIVDDSVANDDDDSIIPETQDVLSQDSIISLSQNESGIERTSELEHTQVNLSEATQIKACNDTIDADESQSNDEELQAATASGMWPIRHIELIIYFLNLFVWKS